MYIGEYRKLNCLDVPYIYIYIYINVLTIVLCPMVIRKISNELRLTDETY